MQALRREPELRVGHILVFDGLLVEQRRDVHPELRDKPDQPPRLLQPERLWRDELFDPVLRGLLRRRLDLHGAECGVRGGHLLQRARHRLRRPLVLRLPRRLLLGLSDVLYHQRHADHGLHAADCCMQFRHLLQRPRVRGGGGRQRADCGSHVHGLCRGHLLGHVDALDHRDLGADGLRLDAECELPGGHLLQRRRLSVRGSLVHGVRCGDVCVGLVGLDLPHVSRDSLPKHVLGLKLCRGPADRGLHGLCRSPMCGLHCGHLRGLSALRILDAGVHNAERELSRRHLVQRLCDHDCGSDVLTMRRRHLLISASELDLRKRVFSLHHAVSLVQRRNVLQCHCDRGGGSHLYAVCWRDVL